MILLGIIALELLIIAGAAFIPVASYKPEQRQLRDESEFNLDEKVGWYQATDGSHWLVTWGAENGLTINRFEPLARGYLQPVSTDICAWTDRKGEEKYQIDFSRNDDGKIIGISWVIENAERQSAKRLDNYGYTQAEVHFQNKQVELVGTLMTPVSTGPHPAVVFIHGSGVSDRNNLWYLHIADFLARQGIVVLFPDKRGCGKSGGEWHIAGFEDFAGDALAGVHYLMQLESVDEKQIGMIGFSQGGWIAPLAASMSPDVSFVVNVSGAAVTPNVQITHEVSADIRNSGVPAAMASVMAPSFAIRAKKKRQVWWEKNGDFDPIPYWTKLNIPIHIVYGKKDEDDNVPVSESVKRLEQAKEKSGNLHFTIKVYGDSGHAIENPHAPTRFAREDYLEMLVEWIHSTP